MNSNQKDEATAGTRAREILGSLKERRDFFESQIAKHQQAAESLNHRGGGAMRREEANLLSPDAVFKPVAVRATPLFTAEEAESITKQLSCSLQERQTRLSNISSTGQRSTSQLDAYLAAKTTISGSLQTPQKMSPGFRSPSTHSISTAETAALTASPQSTPGSDISPAKNQQQWSRADMIASVPRPPTLDDIQEAFVSKKQQEFGKGRNVEATSDTSSSNDEVDLASFSFYGESDGTLLSKESLPSSSEDLPQAKECVPAEKTDGSLPAKTDAATESTQQSVLESSTSTEHETIMPKEEVVENTRKDEKDDDSNKVVRAIIPSLEAASLASYAIDENEAALEKSDNQILGISIANEEDRRKLLEMLQSDLEISASDRHIRVIPLSASPLTLEGDSVFISDESSFDCSTNDSETSGWDSNAEDASEIDDASDIDVVVEKKKQQSSFVRVEHKPKPSSRKETQIKVYRTKGPISIMTGTISDSVIEEVSTEEEKEEEVDRTRVREVLCCPLLFVPEEFSDQWCDANGGHYGLALSTGMFDKCKGSVAKNQTVSATHVCLSPDFRCGAHGSLYDVAQRSGCNVERQFGGKGSGVPSAAKSKRRESSPQNSQLIDSRRQPRKFPSRCLGGLYYIAFKSGLTAEAIRAHRAYAVSTRNSNTLSQTELVPVNMSNRTCGTSGSSLTMALESGMRPIAPSGKFRS